jgi:steroid 5-alpha reductase family enzyme
MSDLDATGYAALCGVGAILTLAFATWLVSLLERDVSIVDSVWTLLILLAAAVYAVTLPAEGPRAAWVLALTALWALRLAGHITWRNWGEPEDHRYQAIRARNQPHYEVKSLYLVFGLQGVLAAIVSLPLLAALEGPRAPNWIDALGIALFMVGFVFETVGDWQLVRFKAGAASRGRVLDSGLWRYTRHPNYFGEFCVWWGLYLVALAAGGWWTIVSPLLMTLLLLKVSGVTLLEKDIGERRPAYREYIARTNAFFPGRPRGVR